MVALRAIRETYANSRTTGPIDNIEGTPPPVAVASESAPTSLSRADNKPCARFHPGVSQIFGGGHENNNKHIVLNTE